MFKSHITPQTCSSFSLPHLSKWQFHLSLNLDQKPSIPHCFLSFTVLSSPLISTFCRFNLRNISVFRICISLCPLLSLCSKLLALIWTTTVTLYSQHSSWNDSVLSQSMMSHLLRTHQWLSIALRVNAKIFTVAIHFLLLCSLHVSHLDSAFPLLLCLVLFYLLIPLP